MAVIDFESAKKAIVQIYGAQSDAIVGTGFWVGGRYLMTCAHVVEAALKPSTFESHKAMKGASVQLRFAQAQQTQRCWAQVVYCQYEPQEGGEDVAVLQLVEAVDVECEPMCAALGFSQVSGAQVRSFGYADGHAGGRNIETVTSGSVGGGGWIQVDSSKERGLAILEGLSGAPVWCDRVGLVGMVVARERRLGERTGLIIPVTALGGARRAVQSWLVCDVLRPYAVNIDGQIRWAYEVCRGRYTPGRAQSELVGMVEDLANRAAGEQSKLLQFVACLLNDLERPAFDTLIDELTALAEQLLEGSDVDLDAIRVGMHDAVLTHQQQRPAPSNPALWVSVHAADITGAPPFSIEAWLVPNPEAYDPQAGSGALKLSSNVSSQAVEAGGAGNSERISEDNLDYAQIPIFMACYLDQIEQGHGIQQEDLTIELFLPLSLMNQPIERMGIPAWMDVEPLGIGEMECPQVLLRSRDRLEQRSRAKSRWHKKWATATANLKTSATTLLAKDSATLDTELKKEQIIGFNLSVSPSSAVGGELFKLIKSGAPVAIWFRDNPHAVTQAQHLENELLLHPLEEISVRVMALRRRTESIDETDCANSPEMGHHLAFLWENPKHVPPHFNDQFSSSPL